MPVTSAQMVLLNFHFLGKKDIAEIFNFSSKPITAFIKLLFP